MDERVSGQRKFLHHCSGNISKECLQHIALHRGHVAHCFHGKDLLGEQVLVGNFTEKLQRCNAQVKGLLVFLLLAQPIHLHCDEGIDDCQRLQICHIRLVHRQSVADSNECALLHVDRRNTRPAVGQAKSHRGLRIQQRLCHRSVGGSPLLRLGPVRHSRPDRQNVEGRTHLHRRRAHRYIRVKHPLPALALLLNHLGGRIQGIDRLGVISAGDRSGQISHGNGGNGSEGRGACKTHGWSPNWAAFPAQDFRSRSGGEG